MTCLMLPFADLSAHADAAPAGGASWRATADCTPASAAIPAAIAAAPRNPFLLIDSPPIEVTSRQPRHRRRRYGRRGGYEMGARARAAWRRRRADPLRA